MISPADFKKATSATFCGRGIELKGIDDALAQCHPLPADAATRKSRLVNVLVAIGIWLTAKTDKHDGKVSELYLKRKKVIEEVRDDALKSVAAASFAKNKALGVVVGTKSLEPGYAFERSNFEAGKRAQGGDYSGVTTGASIVSEAVKKGKMATPGGKRFDNLDKSEFDAVWQKLSDMGLDNPTQQRPNVHLIRKEERVGKFLAWIYNGRFYKQESMEYTSDAKGIEIYAMDRYGNMITMPVSLDYKQNAGGRSYVRGEQPASPRAYGELAQHNHSSLNAGRDVISAGVVRMQQGVITYIDNMSGHYKPTPRQLQRAVRVLREEFADLSQLKVSVFTAIDAAHVAEAVFTNVNVFLDQQL